MAFYEIGYTIVNLDHVRELRRHWTNDPEQRAVTIIYTDGSSERIKTDPDVTYEIETFLAPVVPAAPGFERICYWHDKGDHGPVPADVLANIDRDPIVAWRIERPDPTPISLELNESTGVGKAILRPDGQVVDPGGQSWRDLNAWPEYVCEEYKKQRVDGKAA
jgi:hypothetical protein